MSPEALVRCIDFSYITDVVTPEEALEIFKEKSKTKSERIAYLQKNGYKAYTTSAGWLGYSDEKMLRLCREAKAEGFTHMKMKVGSDLQDDMRRAGIIREEIGADLTLMMDANQKWDVQEAIENMAQLKKYNPYWIEEPTSPDDALGHATIAKAVAPIKVATGEHCQNRVIFKQLMQASAIEICQIDSCRVGGVNEILAILLMATKFDIPVCPHAGGVGLCEYVQHLSMIDYICISGSMDGRIIEYVDHLHEHFLDPVIIKNDGTGASVSGSGTTAKIRGITKAGTLTLTVVFEHPYKDDKSLSGEFVLKATPTNIALSKKTIDENKAIGSTVGTLTTTDDTANDNFTYTFASGDGSDDNADFRIDGAVLKTAKVFDFETKNSYKIRIRTTDKTGLTFEKEFTITINDIVEYGISYAYNSGNKYVEAAANDGSIDNSKFIIATVNGATFNGANGSTLVAGKDYISGIYQKAIHVRALYVKGIHLYDIYRYPGSSNVFTVSSSTPVPIRIIRDNVPSGLTMVVTKISATTAKITFTGKATAHQRITGGGRDDSVANITITFNSSAFTGSPSVSNATGRTKNDIAIEYLYNPPVFSYQFDVIGGDRFYEGNEAGEIEGSLIISVQGASFINAATLNKDTHYTIASVPAGLTPQLKRNINGNFVLSFNGKATAHADANDVNNLTITLLAAALKGNTDLSSVTTKSKNGLIIDFNPYLIRAKNRKSFLEGTYGAGRFSQQDGQNYISASATFVTIDFTQDIITSPTAGTDFTTTAVPDGLTLRFQRFNSKTLFFWFDGAATSHANSDDTTITFTFDKSIFATEPTSNDDIKGRVRTFKIDFVD
uniref:Mitochondrial enolase superfamily member 1 n=1 Tax=Stylophora pistillata TaxID=50429 RepID=A0A2B4RDX4_STYPI